MATVTRTVRRRPAAGERIGRIARRAGFYTLLLAWGAIAMAPFWLSLVYSFMPKEHIYDPPRLWPSPFTLDNYRTVVTAFKLFPRWLLNSALISGIFVVVRTLFCAMGGYAFARMRFPGKSVLFALMLASMMIPGQVTLIPKYLIIGPRVFHLLDKLAGVILPDIATAFGVFMMAQYYKSIPVELEEAARIDGAGRFATFFRIILPVGQTSLLTLALFTFQGSWNEFMWPLIVLQTPANFTLPLGLQWFKNEYYSLYSNVLAGSMFNTLPVVILFFAFQRYFVRSIATTGLKE